jgi:hypothetical protein
MESGHHSQHAKPDREPVQIGWGVPLGEALGGQFGSGLVDGAARTDASGKHFAQHRAEGRNILAGGGGMRTPVEWRRKQNRAALTDAEGPRHNVSVRPALAVKFAQCVGQGGGIFQRGSEGKWSLGQSVGQ